MALPCAGRQSLVALTLIAAVAFLWQADGQTAVFHAEGLQREFEHLTGDFKGRVGVCARDAHGTACVNGQGRFPLQSVMKLLVAYAVVDGAERGAWRLDEAVIVRPQDLSLYVQPIARLVTKEGFRTTLDDLVRRAVVDSDSAAADILIRRMRGPQAITALLRRRGFEGLRLDRDERHLQTEIMGLRWRPAFVDADVLDRTIAAVPESRRNGAWRRYLNDPRDTATPAAMASFLQALAEGRLLSPQGTAHLLAIMNQTVTFPDRLKAGLTSGWTLGHKTGTSNTWQGITAATNDVGVLRSPDGRFIGIAVFIASSPETAERRASLMADLARVTIAAEMQ
jgi:beta-lactamase class A